MSAQLSLDSMQGINWDSPRHEQLEQFALDHVDGARTFFDDIHGIGMCVFVQVGKRIVAMKPNLQRTAYDNLEWVVLFQALGSVVHKELRSDAELVAALAAVFEEGK